MNTLEKHATLSLAGLFSLRMLGLFMILPVFTPYAKTLPGSTPFLIGFALGIYGLTQALFQLPFGALSDHYPRKKIIMLGFSIFTLGSIIAALSHTLWGVIIGRALQGMGAVGSVIIALLADLTRPEKRSKAMAIIGMIIGLSFFLALLLGPILEKHIQVSGIFWLTAGMGIIAILATRYLVPAHIHVPKTLNQTHSFMHNTKILLSHKTLLKFDIGIFILHAILTATFVVMPLYIKNIDIYIPALIIAIILTFLIIGLAEKNKKVHIVYRVAILGLVLSELLLWHYHASSPFLIITSLTLFFTSFNLLEANLPSLISRTAPPDIKGTAIGIYSTFQFLGIFIGGMFGGLIYGHISASAVLLACAILSLIWLIVELGN